MHLAALAGLVVLAGCSSDRATSDGGDPADPCTRVLGFSVTIGWYRSDGTSAASGFERVTGAPDGWELMAGRGHGISHWGAGGPGWEAPVTYASCGGDPDRVVLQVAIPEPASDERVLSELRAAVAEMRRRFPGARLDLMAIPDGPGCDTWSESIHDQMLRAIRGVANGIDVFEGPDTRVTSCSHYRDDRGHLTREGGVVVATQVADFYRVGPESVNRMRPVFFATSQRRFDAFNRRLSALPLR
jgi:hypothetical protein